MLIYKMSNERTAVIIIGTAAVVGVIYYHLTTGMWEDKDEK